MDVSKIIERARKRGKVVGRGTLEITTEDREDSLGAMLNSVRVIVGEADVKEEITEVYSKSTWKTIKITPKSKEVLVERVREEEDPFGNISIERTYYLLDNDGTWKEFKQRGRKSRPNW